jgi:hypothetical protein
VSFSKQAAIATVVVTGSVAGLVALGRRDADKSAEVPTAAASAAATGDAAPTADSKPLVAPADLRTKGALVRELALPGAWLVADFQGDLTGQKPFADQPGLCAQVEAPERVALAVLAPKGAQGLELLIAARNVEDVFWGCARDRIVSAGGTALAQNDRYEVLKSPSGVVARGPGGSMVFLTSEAYLEPALAAVSGLAAGAATEGPHAALYGRMHGAGNAAQDSVLDITLALPKDWLGQVEQDAEKSPLRFIHSAFLGVHVDGSASGGVDCDEVGCPEVLAFLKRAKSDLAGTLPPETRSVIEASLQAEHLAGTGRIRLDWSPSKAPLGSLLGSLLGSTPFGP